MSFRQRRRPSLPWGSSLVSIPGETRGKVSCIWGLGFSVLFSDQLRESGWTEELGWELTSFFFF